MSSLRNAISRRPHRERAQPHSREKWGLLEKHKDYSLRAADFKTKQSRLRTLRQKAVDRNPDEFHFAMMSSKSVGGRKVTDRGNKSLSMDVVRLLKTQDAGYLRTVGNRVRRERERLEGVIVFGEGGETGVGTVKGEEKSGSHVVFVDSKDEQREFDAENWFGTDKDGLGRSWNRQRRQVAPLAGQEDAEEAVHSRSQKQPRSKRAIEAELQVKREERATRKKLKRYQEAQRVRLNALKQKEKELMAAEQELELQRAKMSGSVGGVTKNGIKFKVRERKR